MNNVIPLRPDPLRNLYELIDTKPTPEQKRIINDALALVQKMIEAKHANRTDQISRGDFHPSA